MRDWAAFLIWGLTGLETRDLEILVLVVIAGEIRRKAPVFIFVADFESIDVLGLDRNLRSAADIQNARLVTARIGGIDARIPRWFVTQHDAGREAGYSSGR